MLAGATPTLASALNVVAVRALKPPLATTNNPAGSRVRLQKSVRQAVRHVERKNLFGTQHMGKEIPAHDAEK